jgi:hypothetical protein
MEGLDSQSLTLEKARDLLAERGHSLSHEAIAGYYRAVRRERRLHDANFELTRMIDQFKDQPTQQALQGLLNLTIGITAAGLADGTVGIKDIDLAQVMKAVQAPAPSVQPEKTDKMLSREEGPATEPVEQGLSAATAKMIREAVLGVRKPGASNGQ